MNLNHNELRKLAEVIRLTKDQEIDCSEFLHRMAALVETVMAGKKVSEAQVLQHLSVCPECAEEVEVLIQALSPPSS